MAAALMAAIAGYVVAVSALLLLGNIAILGTISHFQILCGIREYIEARELTKAVVELCVFVWFTCIQVISTLVGTCAIAVVDTVEGHMGGDRLTPAVLCTGSSCMLTISLASAL